MKKHDFITDLEALLGVFTNNTPKRKHSFYLKKNRTSVEKVKLLLGDFQSKIDSRKVQWRQTVLILIRNH